MKLSMEFLAVRLGEKTVSFSLNGRRNPVFRTVKLYTPGSPMEDEVLYCCDPTVTENDLEENRDRKNVGVVWTNPDAPPPDTLPVMRFSGKRPPQECYNMIMDVFVFFNEWGSRVYDAMLENRDLYDVFSLLDQVTPNPWYLCDSSYRMIVIKRAPEAEEMSAIWRFQYREKHLPIHVVLSLAEEGKIERMNQYKHAYMPAHDDLPPFNNPFISKTIYAAKGILGHFFIVGFYTKLSSYEMEIAEFFGNLLSKTFSGNPSYLPTSGRFYDNYFIDLIEGADLPTVEIMEEVFRVFGWSVDDSFAVIALQRTGKDDLERTIDNLEIHVMETMHGCRCFLYHNKVVAVLNITHKRQNDPDYGSKELAGDVESILRDFGGHGGISEMFSGKTEFEELQVYYKQASIALKYAAMENPMTYYMYSQVIMQYLSHELLENKEHRYMFHRALNVLGAYDAENDSHLCQTLRCYLVNEQNTVHTAKALFIHRNTLMYRLQKIDQLTHLDLGDIDVRMRLMLSFYLLDAKAAGLEQDDIPVGTPAGA
ncbi:MAG: helix-turn-helix domain-containing protein [Oscillospiraceae bacterium]|nr:helix-turn-helix domain-containing protein [Oscillospiraceae bacterium]